MGSSTRNVYKRASLKIQQGIKSGIVGSTGKGIGGLLSGLLYPDKGASKIRSELQTKLYSEQISSGIKKIYGFYNAFKKDDLSSLGLGGIFSLTNVELKEKLNEYFEFDNDELLKISLNETLDSEKLFDKNLNILIFISNFITKVIINIYKKFTYEDAINELPDFNFDDYNNDLNNYMEKNVSPVVRLNITSIDFEALSENDQDRKIYTTMTSIMNKLRKVESN